MLWTLSDYDLLKYRVWTWEEVHSYITELESCVLHHLPPLETDTWDVVYKEARKWGSMGGQFTKKNDTSLELFIAEFDKNWVSVCHCTWNIFVVSDTVASLFV
jgi:hypothetical protein